jgi:hypothetical protein
MEGPLSFLSKEKIMSNRKCKTEHNGSKKGVGAYWGTKVEAKTYSKHKRRQQEEKDIEEQLNAEIWDENYERFFVEKRLEDNESKNIIENNKVKKLFNSYPNEAEIAYCNNDAFSISWSLKGIGFGELTFYKDDNKWKIDSETMGKETVKRILAILVDSLPLN